MSTATPYDIIGKEEGVKALAAAFYESMEELEEAESVRRMHAANLDLIKQKLFEYLNGWLGGPHLYKDKYGTICLTEPHQPYPIGEAQRDQWIACWDRALEKVDAPEEFRAMTRQPIQRMASFLVNA
ncbi:MAG: group II truncated hemoglobin [Gammaproteobacteria bacterium]|jgi:hemoglobin